MACLGTKKKLRSILGSISSGKLSLCGEALKIIICNSKRYGAIFCAEIRHFSSKFSLQILWKQLALWLPIIKQFCHEHKIYNFILEYRAFVRKVPEWNSILNISVVIWIKLTEILSLSTIKLTEIFFYAPFKRLIIISVGSFCLWNNSL